jgi:hypothetical protein
VKVLPEKEADGQDAKAALADFSDSLSGASDRGGGDKQRRHENG